MGPNIDSLATYATIYQFRPRTVCIADVWLGTDGKLRLCADNSTVHHRTSAPMLIPGGLLPLSCNPMALHLRMTAVPITAASDMVHTIERETWERDHSLSA